MAEEIRLSELLLHWEDLRNKGEALSAKQLCDRFACPQFAAELQRRIDALELLDSRLRSADQATTATSPSQSEPQDFAPITPGRSSDRKRLTTGMVLADRYRIVSSIGRGGMGDVYRAEDLKLGSPVALKFVPAALARDPNYLALL